MAGYDPAAANEYNQLIQQGLDPDEAAAMAGISLSDIGNYSIVNGQLTQNEGPPVNDQPVNPANDPSQSPAYDDDGNLQPGFAINDENGQPYFQGFNVTRDQPINPASDPSQFPAYDDDGNLQPGFAINDENGQPYFQGFNVTRDRPVNPASDPSQFPAYDDDGNLQPGFAINDENGQPYYRGFGVTRDQPVSSDLDPWYSGFDTAGLTSPDTTRATDLNDPYYGLSPKQLQDLGGADPTDPYIRARLGIPQLPGSPLAVNPGIGTVKTGVPLIDNALNFLGGLFRPAPTPPKTDQPVNPASDPSQFPAYDDDGNLQPGFAINEETGQPYYRGFEVTRDQPVNPASDPSQFPAYDDDGNLQPGFAINEENGQPYYRGFDITTDQPVNPASDPSQFPAYDDDGNLQPGFAINEETGQPYYRGFPQPTDNTPVSLDVDSGYGSEFGYSPPDVAALSRDARTVRATNPNLSPDAQANLDGINEANAEILKAQGNIQSNNLNILRAEEGIATARETQRQAEAIIAQNNAELADPFITDERRAELLANNAEQEASIAENARYIDDQTQYIEDVEANNAQQQDNITTNQLVAEENAAAFRYNDGGELLTVEPNLDPELEETEQLADAPTSDDVQTLSDEETAALFGEETEPLAEPPVEAPRLLSDEEIDAIYPPINPNEKEAIYGTRIISDEARASLSDPEAIKAQLALNEAPRPDVVQAELVPLSEEENAALFAEEEASVVEVTDAENVDTEVDPELAEPEGADFVDSELAEPVDPDADPELLGGPEEEIDAFAPLEEPPDVDAEEAPELLGGPEEEVDPFAPLEEPSDVDAEESPELLGGPEEEVDPFAPLEEPPDVDAEESPELLGGPDEEEPGEPELLGGPEEVDAATDPALSDEEILARQNPEGLSDEEILARQGAATKEKAKQQATFQARYKQPGNQDWRVRLSLSPNANYLYNAGTPRGSGAGILAPLAATDGVIFPYTPTISTTYSANYEQYDLVHSNYRGVFYKNSRVGDINIRGTFTAQDTVEANYLLAVIHFFRSATKMFYGQDPERGTPPPVCLLNGLGQYQFSDHPVVISSFNYTTPNDVDYIRAVNPNNYGENLLNRRAAVASNPGGSSIAGLNRLLNALPSGLAKGALPSRPAPGSVTQSVANTAGATYVPTKVEIDITLIPVQTRAQVSKQFSLKGFANGELLKGGYW